MLLSTGSEPLADHHDVVLFDLDGVVYIGPDAVDHAASVVDALRERGIQRGYITNNASRPPSVIADKLREIGIAGVEDADIVTSAQAVARMIAKQVPAGANVLVVGGAGLHDALRAHGLHGVSSAEDDPAAVVQGFSADLNWSLLSEGGYAIQAGVPWFASNLDLTFPSPRGPAPANGSFVQVLERITGRQPSVAGKPERALFDESVIRTEASRPLVVGDRLDTDIRGARAAEIPSMAVLTGVSDLATLIAAEDRPDYVAADLRGLLDAHPQVELGEELAACGPARVRLDDGAIRVLEAGDHTTALIRAVITLAWSMPEESRDAADLSEVLAVTDERMNP